MYHIELVFGHSRATGEALPRHRIACAEHRALIFFAQCFGGGYLQKTIGSYQATDNHCLIETCTILRSHTNDVKNHWDDLHALARDIATLLEQACVLVTVSQVDGSLTLVQPALLEPME